MLAVAMFDCKSTSCVLWLNVQFEKVNKIQKHHNIFRVSLEKITDFALIFKLILYKIVTMFIVKISEMGGFMEN